MFDPRLPPAAVLTEQRIRFVSHLFHAAGFAGWCLLLDEVELIGRYTPLQRALAYACLSVWLGLDPARRFPGIVTVYAITDDFVAAVIDHRQDDEKLPERLRLKGRGQDAVLAMAAIHHVEHTVRQRRLRLPGLDELDRTCLRLREIYEAAHDWLTPELPQSERTATRTMRQYIKSWITQWDLQRLTGSGVAIVEQTITANYEENDGLGTIRRTSRVTSGAEPANPASLSWRSPQLDYQVAGVHRLVDRQEVLPEDEMGLGKTIQSIGTRRLLLRDPQEKPALILVPTGCHAVVPPVARPDGRTDACDLFRQPR